MRSNVAKQKVKQHLCPTQNVVAGSCVHAILLQGRGKRYSDVLWESQGLLYLEFSGSVNACYLLGNLAAIFWKTEEMAIVL